MHPSCRESGSSSITRLPRCATVEVGDCEQQCRSLCGGAMALVRRGYRPRRGVGMDTDSLWSPAGRQGHAWR